MTDKWFAFIAYNTETMYGFGTDAEASKYQDHLNKDRGINQYSIVPVKNPTIINSVVFNIANELQAIEDKNND